MCMWMFDDENTCFDKITKFFNIAIFRQLHLVNNGVDSAYSVKSAPLGAFIGYFQHFSNILKMCMKLFNAEKYFLTNLQGF